MIEVPRRHELRGELQQAMGGLDIVLTATQPAEAVRPAQLYGAVQRRRLPGDFDLRPLWRRRTAGGDPVGRQAVPGTDAGPHRRRLRKGDPVPQPAPDVRLSPSGCVKLRIRLDRFSAFFETAAEAVLRVDRPLDPLAASSE